MIRYWRGDGRCPAPFGVRGERIVVSGIPGVRVARIRLAVLAGLFVAAVFLAALCANAETFYVAPSGSDQNAGTAVAPWKTIQGGVDRLAAGDQLIVRAGTYPERVSTRAAGTAASPITISAYAGEVVTLHRLYLRHDYVRLSGLKFAGMADVFRILYVDGDHCRIENCHIDAGNETRKGIEGAVYSSSANVAVSCVISNCVIERINNTTAIMVWGKDWIVEDCTVRDCADADFVRVFGPGHRIRGNTVHNFVDGPGLNHLDFIQTFGDSLQTPGLQEMACRDVVVERNYSYDMGAQLCQMTWDGVPTIGHVVFRNNIFRNFLGAGNVSIPATEWYNNIFYNVNQVSAHPLCFVGNAHNTILKNNMFIGCGSDPSKTWQGWYLISGPTGCVADYNLVTSGQAGGYAAKHAGYFLEPHGISGGNPCLVSPDTHDFHLLADSPAIDKGTPIASFGDDRDGYARGSLWDIGPHEYGAGVTGPRPEAPTNLRSVPGP